MLFALVVQGYVTQLKVNTFPVNEGEWFDVSYLENTDALPHPGCSYNGENFAPPSPVIPVVDVKTQIALLKSQCSDLMRAALCGDQTAVQQLKDIDRQIKDLEDG